MSHTQLLMPQAETLIVWTEPSTGIDMALSFQEADGCAQIWFVATTGVQHLHSTFDLTTLTRLPLKEIRQ